MKSSWEHVYSFNKRLNWSSGFLSDWPICSSQNFPWYVTNYRTRSVSQRRDVSSRKMTVCANSTNRQTKKIKHNSMVMSKGDAENGFYCLSAACCVLMSHIRWRHLGLDKYLSTAVLHCKGCHFLTRKTYFQLSSEMCVLCVTKRDYYKLRSSICEDNWREVTERQEAA